MSSTIITVNNVISKNLLSQLSKPATIKKKMKGAFRLKKAVRALLILEAGGGQSLNVGGGEDSTSKDP